MRPSWRPRPPRQPERSPGRRPARKAPKNCKHAEASKQQSAWLVRPALLPPDRSGRGQLRRRVSGGDRTGRRIGRMCSKLAAMGIETGARHTEQLALTPHRKPGVTGIHEVNQRPRRKDEIISLSTKPAPFPAARPDGAPVDCGAPHLSNSH